MVGDHPAGPLIAPTPTRRCHQLCYPPSPGPNVYFTHASNEAPTSPVLEFLDFLREELLDFTKKGFWLVLPYRMVQQLAEVGPLCWVLRVSPMGVVPQRNRRPRLIVDLSFYDINS